MEGKGGGEGKRGREEGKGRGGGACELKRVEGKIEVGRGRREEGKSEAECIR